ncbi:phage tail protein [Novosphingobium sp.]|uniref:GTA baseplate fiber-binding domain-containing protein n=1 Tax=Novosphingobium sp. TaxID=1874826 RepID=UPI0038B92D83
MATLLLTVVGTAVGGPLSGAIGALVGRGVDSAIIGGRKIEGPRLKELAVQTSSYGTALPLHFGTVRTAGSVIWSTDLVEHRTSNGGGKGRPSTTSYSYSASFAVAVACRPILGIGRVWADGNLLRGAAGDLKSAGTMRIHTGHGDQACDPLMAQAEGMTRCPAHRNSAYVLFEDLDLTDFGNRLPSLTFEVIADADGISVADIVGEILPDASVTDLATQFGGFTIDQGSAGDTLATLSEVAPMTCATQGDRLAIGPAEGVLPSALPMLPPPAASEDQQADAVKVAGWSRSRDPMPAVRLCGLRYYDTARDYQPGMQRGIGRCEAGNLRTIELPATMDAAAARAFAEAASRRAARPTDTITYRITEIATSIGPGTLVRTPVADGVWRIDRWEWQKDGILLELVASGRRPMPAIAMGTGDAGRATPKPDLALPPTILTAFELPWDGTGSGNTPALFAAASAASAGWRGAALFVAPTGEDGTLLNLASTNRIRAISGQTQTILANASPLLIDRGNTLDVALDGADLELADATLAQLLQGANRALVGREIIQFGTAHPLGGGVWRLGTLLRGRGGTEAAVASHHIGERFVLLDGNLTPIDPTLVADPATARIVALGLGDDSAVHQPIVTAGATLQALSPVHGKVTRTSDGGVQVIWTRRARGSWMWPDAVETPLNEERELYQISYGVDSSPVRIWQVTTPVVNFTAADLADLSATGAPNRLQVRQLGRGLPSPPLSLALP